MSIKLNDTFENDYLTQKELSICHMIVFAKNIDFETIRQNYDRITEKDFELDFKCWEGDRSLEHTIPEYLHRSIKIGLIQRWKHMGRIHRYLTLVPLKEFPVVKEIKLETFANINANVSFLYDKKLRIQTMAMLNENEVFNLSRCKKVLVGRYIKALQRYEVDKLDEGDDFCKKYYIQ